MATQSDVAARIVSTLGITEPDLDTSVGSVTRKIIDAVAQQIADAYVDDHLLTYQYDIDSKIEADLDDFVQLFGMSRIGAKRATGVVTFQRGAGSTRDGIQIPVNTQIASSLVGTSNVVTMVQTVTPGFIGQGQTTVEVPVQAIEPGVVGNVGAGLLTRVRTPLEGVRGIVNIQPLTGGVGAETDSELRARWKRTVFRSLAGTEAMYLGIALNHEDCFGANVLGATKTISEQVQIDLDGVGSSSADDVSFAYADTAVLGPHLAGSQVLLRDHDYVLDTSVRPPKVRMLRSTYLTGRYLEGGAPEVAAVAGSVFDLTYEYAPDASRNRPGQGITNRVDIYCAGIKAATATQAVIFSSTKRFVQDSGSPYYIYNYERPDASPPKSNNIFIPLGFGPILTLPTTLTVAGGTYKINEDYWLVHDVTAAGFTATSRFGLEWNSQKIPAGLNPVFIVGENDQYTYNQMVEEIQGGIDRWRLVGIDAKAHAAHLQYLRFNIAVMYDRGASADLTNGEIEIALQKYVRSLSFGSTVQVSDVLQAIHSAPGVDNVRFLDSRDWQDWDPTTPNDFGVGIQRVVYDADGTARVVESYVEGAFGAPKDITFGDAEVPVYESFRGDRLGDNGEAPSGVPAVRAQNTFYKGVAVPTGGNTGGGGGGSDPVYPPPGRPTAGANAAAIAPRVLTGSQDTDTTTLTWDETPSASGYLVYRNSETTPFRGLGPAQGTFKENTVSFPNEPAGTTFYVHVYVQYDAEGNIPEVGIGAPSNPFRPEPAGGTPSDIILTGEQAGLTVTLEWTEYGPSIQGYTVYRDGVLLLSLGPANGTPRGLTATFTTTEGPHTYVVKGYTTHTGSTHDANYTISSNPLALP